MLEPIAVLADIHGNLRALEAVLAEIEVRAIHRVVNLGDCLYGPFDARPVADRLIDLGIPTVAGNEDRILVPGAATPLRSKAARFTRARLGTRHLEWLASLPLSLCVGDAFLCHGVPTDDTAYLLSRVSGGALAIRGSEEIETLLGTVSQRRVFCGHDHTARMVVTTRHLVVNPGSVGCPAYSDDIPAAHVVESGSPHARFAVVRPGGERGTSVDLIAVPYDATTAAAEATANGFPDWAHWVATGRAR